MKQTAQERISIGDLLVVYLSDALQTALLVARSLA